MWSEDITLHFKNERNLHLLVKKLWSASNVAAAGWNNKRAQMCWEHARWCDATWPNFSLFVANRFTIQSSNEFESNRKSPKRVMKESQKSPKRVAKKSRKSRERVAKESRKSRKRVAKESPKSRDWEYFWFRNEIHFFVSVNPASGDCSCPLLFGGWRL